MTMKKSTIKRVHDYAASIRDGRIPSCEMVRLAVDRWYLDWERKDIHFVVNDFNRFVRFSRMLKHYKGELAGQFIRLEDWQLFIVANVFGWKFRSTGLRRYTYADVYVPRKNGKTTFAAIIALYMLLFDGEAAAEIYAAAVDKEQAKICFDTAKHLIEASDFAEIVRVFKGSIVVEETASVFKPLSKDTKNKDGLNPQCGICDERHAWATNEIYEVLKTGMGARRQPLIFSISTAGTDTSNPYFRDLEFLRNVMRGTKSKDNHFIYLYEPDEGDKWDSEETWRKVNPNYGISLSKDYMIHESREAKEKGGSTLAAFCTKNLNMWVDAPEVWIPDDDVQANNAEFDTDTLLGKPCYVGIDFARKTDISAVAFYFPDVKVARIKYLIPEAKIQSESDRVDYRQWYESGWIDKVPGAVVDEDFYMAWIVKELDKYDVRAIAYDPWGMWNVLNKFGRYSDVLLEYQQNIRYMSVPTKWLEAEVFKHNLNFLGDPVLRWMFGNVVVYTDPNANIKLDKGKSRNKIDGVVALVDAIGGWLNKTSGEPDVITDYNGVISINLFNDL